MLSFQIEKLPDEVILLVLSFLSIKDLIKCSQLSRRFRTITYDKSLWQKSNLYQKIVPAKYVEMVINKGCLYLNLSCINMVGGFKCLRKDSNLRYLNLFCFGLNGESFEEREELLAACSSLEKLSMRSQNIYFNTVQSISSGVNILQRIQKIPYALKISPHLVYWK